MNENASTLTQDAGPATPEQIKELPRRYAIGKRPLSRLLGWGELTYTRLLDGGVPNAAHSEEIRQMLNDPAAFARLLEIGRAHKVITGAAYDKSRRAVDALLAEAGHSEIGDALKIFTVADRICMLTDGNVTPRTLQMLMHVAQERSRANGEALFDQEATQVEWGFEYPQIAAGYSFEAIQDAANRLGTTIATTDAALIGFDPVVEIELEPEIAAVPEPEPEPEPSKKKGKKGKKDKKGKGKKKGKKAKGAAEAAIAEAVKTAPNTPAAPATATAPRPAPIAEPVAAKAKGGVPDGPLSLAECKLVDDVVARYLENLSASFSVS